LHLFSFSISKQALKTFETIPAVKQHLKALKGQGKSIGLVPTMGALHKGHLELIRQSKRQTDITIVSIFVNPIQFNNPEDLRKYPRTMTADLAALHEEQVDLVFAPSELEIYPQPVLMQFNFGPMENVLEGMFRPGHFNGVAIVVSKLFHILEPDLAFFGQKDLQQVTIIKKMVNDLSFGTKVETIPTIRENDGLALSSRNQRLSPKGRKLAPLLYLVLSKCKDELLMGTDWLNIKNKIVREVLSPFDIEPEYVELVEEANFTPVQTLLPGKSYAICIAATIEEVRLIDNIVIHADKK
jgi:pantoate--beta-alanine ligase